MKQRLINFRVFKCSWTESLFFLNQFSITCADFKVKITANNWIYDISILHQMVFIHYSYVLDKYLRS